MLRPDIRPGIEQRDDFAGLGVERAYMGPLARVAARAGQAEILFGWRSAQHNRNHVINWERSNLAILIDSAEFTPITGP